MSHFQLRCESLRKERAPRIQGAEDRRMRGKAGAHLAQPVWQLCALLLLFLTAVSGEQAHSRGAALTLQRAAEGSKAGIKSADYKQWSAKELLEELTHSQESHVALSVADGHLNELQAASLPNDAAAVAKPSVSLPQDIMEEIHNAAARSGRAVVDACASNTSFPAHVQMNNNSITIGCSTSPSDGARKLAELIQAQNGSNGASALLLRGSPMATLEPNSRRLLEEQAAETNKSTTLSQQERELMHVQAVLIQIVAVSGVLVTMLACGLGCMSVLDAPTRFDKPGGSQSRQQQGS